MLGTNRRSDSSAVLYQEAWSVFLRDPVCIYVHMGILCRNDVFCQLSPLVSRDSRDKIARSLSEEHIFSFITLSDLVLTLEKLIGRHNFRLSGKK